MLPGQADGRIPQVGGGLDASRRHVGRQALVLRVVGCHLQGNRMPASDHRARLKPLFLRQMRIRKEDPKALAHGNAFVLLLGVEQVSLEFE